MSVAGTSNELAALSEEKTNDVQIKNEAPKPEAENKDEKENDKPVVLEEASGSTSATNEL